MFNVNTLNTIGIILLPVILLPILNYKLIDVADDEQSDSVLLLSEKDYKKLNDEEEEKKVDNVFKNEKVLIKEEIPKFKANQIKYKKMMLDDKPKESINKVNSVNVKKISDDNKDNEENDSIEILEL